MQKLLILSARQILVFCTDFRKHLWWKMQHLEQIWRLICRQCVWITQNSWQTAGKSFEHLWEHFLDAIWSGFCLSMSLVWNDWFNDDMCAKRGMDNPMSIFSRLQFASSPWTVFSLLRPSSAVKDKVPRGSRQKNSWSECQGCSQSESTWICCQPKQKIKTAQQHGRRLSWMKARSKKVPKTKFRALFF